MSNIKKDYFTKGRELLKKELKLTNVLTVPALDKIVVNMGVGDAMADKKVMENASEQLSLITGQKPLVTKAKKDISSFKVRKGAKIGIKVTLRGERMYDFLEKLVKIVLPRIRDFRGVPHTGFDGFGNYTLGIKEQIVFPEIDYNKVDKIRGLEVTFVTTAKNDEHAKSLFIYFGMPFMKNK